MNVRIIGVYLCTCYLMVQLIACQINETDYNARFQPYTDEFAKFSGYNLLQPSSTFILPGILTEISGVSMLNDSVVACIQDEAGVIFMYGMKQRKIVDRIRFSRGGDYEGIEVVGNQVYILRSNGKIYQVSLEDNTTITLNTSLKGDNNPEGLGYDKKNNQLLVSTKGKAGLEGQSIAGRAIYGYHLDKGFNHNPVFIITSKDLESWNVKQQTPLKLTQKKKAFKPSGVAVHPETGDIFLIAYVGRLLLVLSAEGQIKYAIPLSPRIFRQPEGICFTSVGDLIISSEGQDGSGKIQMFKKGGAGLMD